MNTLCEADWAIVVEGSGNSILYDVRLNEKLNRFSLVHMSAAMLTLGSSWLKNIKFWQFLWFVLIQLDPNSLLIFFLIQTVINRSSLTYLLQANGSLRLPSISHYRLKTIQNGSRPDLMALRLYWHKQSRQVPAAFNSCMLVLFLYIGNNQQASGSR